MIDDEYDNDGSDSGFTGTCNFTFRFEDSVDRVDNYVGHVRGMGSGVLLLYESSQLVMLFCW